MHTLIVYESMYGNTHAIADHVGTGLRGSGEVRVVPVGDASPEQLEWADLVVVGGPTHAHSMTSSTSRKSAREAAAKPDSGLTMDPDAEGEGLRDWFQALEEAQGKHAAAFDTRIDAPAMLTGRASRGIARRLRQHGFEMVAEPESFLVTKTSALVDGEADRAVAWGRRLAGVPAGT
jgi:hypothetical protein